MPTKTVLVEADAESTYNPLLLADDRQAPLSRQWLDQWGEELSWRDDDLHAGGEDAVKAHTILAEFGGHLPPEAEVSMYRSAGRDLQRAMLRYDERSPGLGQEFVQAIASELALLAENPRSGTIVKSRKPTCPPGPLAYTIVYNTKDGSLLVGAIANRRRGPDPEVVAERDAQLARQYAEWGEPMPDDARWAAAWGARNQAARKGSGSSRRTPDIARRRHAKDARAAIPRKVEEVERRPVVRGGREDASGRPHDPDWTAG